jgi:hypothetical protein
MVNKSKDGVKIIKARREDAKTRREAREDAKARRAAREDAKVQKEDAKVQREDAKVQREDAKVQREDADASNFSEIEIASINATLASLDEYHFCNSKSFLHILKLQIFIGKSIENGNGVLFKQLKLKLSRYLNIFWQQRRCINDLFAPLDILACKKFAGCICAETIHSYHDTSICIGCGQTIVI